MSSKKFPIDRIGTFQGLRKQIAFELNVFNLHRMYQEYQKSYGIFAEILYKLIHQDSKKEEPIDIDIPKAKRFLKLYEGAEDSHGLFALDIIERKSEGGKYKLLCRGLGKTATTGAFLDPEKHHTLIMKIYKVINPILFELWHSIGSQVEDEGFHGIKLKWKDDSEPPKEPEETDLLDSNIIPQFEVSFEDLIKEE